ncbi:MAG: hypothetical protein WCO93_05095 [bacterium]
MGIDIKFPIGLMFTILGILLTLYGIFTLGDQSLYERSLNININLWSGMGMLIFGVLMLLFSRKAKNAKKE